jgi:hypothetical protein
VHQLGRAGTRLRHLPGCTGTLSWGRGAGRWEHANTLYRGDIHAGYLGRVQPCLLTNNGQAAQTPVLAECYTFGRASSPLQSQHLPAQAAVYTCAACTRTSAHQTELTCTVVCCPVCCRTPSSQSRSSCPSCTSCPRFVVSATSTAALLTCHI